jgi:hypothetical protein
VRRGVVTELQQAGSAIALELAEACREISFLWPALTPPKGTPPLSRAMERQMSIAWDFET